MSECSAVARLRMAALAGTAAIALTAGSANAQDTSTPDDPPADESSEGRLEDNRRNRRAARDQPSGHAAFGGGDDRGNGGREGDRGPPGPRRLHAEPVHFRLARQRQQHPEFHHPRHFRRRRRDGRTRRRPLHRRRLCAPHQRLGAARARHRPRRSAARAARDAVRPQLDRRRDPHLLAASRRTSSKDISAGPSAISTGTTSSACSTSRSPTRSPCACRAPGSTRTGTSPAARRSSAAPKT